MNKKVKILFKACFTLYAFTTIISVNAQPIAVRVNAEMGKGITLGNTLEPPNEGDWNNGPAHEYYFDDFRAAGFTCVRIPVRWDRHTATFPPYTIDENWIARVEQVVDWGLDRGLCVILNTHHEEWLKLGYRLQENRDRFDSIWSQISSRFSKKSEKLVFEIIDEPSGLSAAEVNELNMRILSIIRIQNPMRIVLYSGNRQTGPDELLTAKIPRDDYLIGTFHYFEPENFAQLGVTSWGNENEINALRKKFKQVSEWGLNNQLPINMGEFGAIQNADFNSRMHYYAICAEECLKNSFSFNVWDDGNDFPLYHRKERQWNLIKDILMTASSYSPTSLKISVFQDSIISLSWSNRAEQADELVLERKKEDTNWEMITTLHPDSTSFIDKGLATDNTYYYRVIVRDKSIQAPSYPVKIFLPHYQRYPFHGIPAQIPGTVEAEDFDIGFEGYTYHDNDSKNIPGKYRPNESVDISSRWNGYQITHVAEGEWCEYTLHVNEVGKYRVETYVSAQEAGGEIQLTIGDDSLKWTVPSTGNWLNQVALSGEVELDSGICILKVEVLSLPKFNIDRYVFRKASETVPIPDGRDGILVYTNRKGTLTIFDRDTRGGTIEFFTLNGRFIKKESFSQQTSEFLFPFNHILIYRVVLNDGKTVTGKLFSN